MRTWWTHSWGCWHNCRFCWSWREHSGHLKSFSWQPLPMLRVPAYFPPRHWKVILASEMASLESHLNAWLWNPQTDIGQQCPKMLSNEREGWENRAWTLEPPQISKSLTLSVSRKKGIERKTLKDCFVWVSKLAAAHTCTWSLHTHITNHAFDSNAFNSSREQNLWCNQMVQLNRLHSSYQMNMLIKDFKDKALKS